MAIHSDSVYAKNMEDIHGHLADIESLNIDQRYNDILGKADALQKDSDIPDHEIFLKDGLKYKLIIECNALLEDIDNKICILSKLIRHNYGPHYPRLVHLVDNDPIIYARAAKKIGNEMDLTLVDLKELLSPNKNRSFKASYPALADCRLTEDVLQKTLEACDRVIELDTARKKILDLVESAMVHIAPNLSAIVGSAVAAKLMVSAGGLAALADMPASDVQLLGVKEKILAGASPFLRVGHIMESELYQTTDQLSKLRVCRLLADTSVRAARVDFTRGDPTGKTGRTLLEEIRNQLPFDLRRVRHFKLETESEGMRHFSESLLEAYTQRWLANKPRVCLRGGRLVKIPRK